MRKYRELNAEIPRVLVVHILQINTASISGLCTADTGVASTRGTGKIVSRKTVYFYSTGTGSICAHICVVPASSLSSSSTRWPPCHHVCTNVLHCSNQKTHGSGKSFTRRTGVAE